MPTTNAMRTLPMCKPHCTLLLIVAVPRSGLSTTLDADQGSRCRSRADGWRHRDREHRMQCQTPDSRSAGTERVAMARDRPSHVADGRSARR